MSSSKFADWFKFVAFMEISYLLQELILALYAVRYSAAFT